MILEEIHGGVELFCNRLTWTGQRPVDGRDARELKDELNSLAAISNQFSEGSQCF